MNIIPLQTEKIEIQPKLSLVAWIEQSLKKNDHLLEDGDILIMSSKIVSYFEHRIIDLRTIKISLRASRWAKKMEADPRLIQLVLEEADKVIAQTSWVLLTRKNGIYSANAGIDLSNVTKGYAVLWPKNPFRIAKKIREKLMKKYRLKNLAVLIIDSACQPGRKGTTSIAIGFSGLQGFQQLKGHKDLYGNVLRYSALNIVDSLATAANLLMGESDESRPIAIIRDYCWKSKKRLSPKEMIIDPSDEMYPIL